MFQKPLHFKISNLIRNIINFKSELSNHAKIEPKHFYAFEKYNGHGVTVNKTRTDDLILISSFYNGNPGYQIIQRDGKVIKEWSGDYFSIFKNTDHTRNKIQTNWNIDIHGIVADPDGSVVLNLDYGGLVKVDHCGKIAWALKRETHHTIAKDNKDGYWVTAPSIVQRQENNIYPFKHPTVDSAILHVSKDGEILEEISVNKTLEKNNLTHLLFANGHNYHDWNYNFETTHLNKIEVLRADLAKHFKNFKAGDLALSFRNLNLIVVLDPTTKVIKWYQSGPWLRQHSPQFMNTGEISIYNNNNFYIFNDKNNPWGTRLSNIMAINPETREIRYLYGEKPEDNFVSRVRGKHQHLPNGDLLITDFDHGRVFKLITKEKLYGNT